MSEKTINKVPNVPTLRFREHTDEWHKFALSDFVTRITRRNKNNESSLPLTISAQYGLVDQITFLTKQLQALICRDIICFTMVILPTIKVILTIMHGVQ